MSLMTFQEFEEFAVKGNNEEKSFHDRHPGSYIFPHLKYFFDKNKLVHKELIDKMGGTDILNISMSVEDGQAKLHEDRCNHYQKLFCNLDRGFSNVPVHYFESPLVPTTRNDRNPARVTKYIKKIARDLWGKNKDLDDQVDKILSDLGGEWKNNQSKKGEYNVTISCTPRAFVLLGHYGPDESSCFRQGSSGTLDKWVYGQSPNTSVITIDSELDGERENICRILAHFNFEQGSVLIHNCYFIKGVDIGTMYTLVQKTCEKILGYKLSRIEDCELDPNNDSEYGRGFYYNNDRHLLVDASKDVPSRPNVNMDIKHVKRYACDKCGTFYTGTYSNTSVHIDDMITCTECAKNAIECKFTGKSTFTDSGIQIEIDNDFHQISLEGVELAKEQGYVLCRSCGITLTKNKHILCDNCYTECDYSGVVCSNEETEMFFDEEICPEYAKNLGLTNE